MIIYKFDYAERFTQIAFKKQSTPIEKLFVYSEQTAIIFNLNTHISF